MIILKQKNINKMKMAHNYVCNPVGAKLKWPNAPDVGENDIDVDVISYENQQAIVVPVKYLRGLFDTAPEDTKKFLNEMVSILVKDQEELTMEIEFTGKRGTYTAR